MRWTSGSEAVSYNCFSEAPLVTYAELPDKTTAFRHLVSKVLSQRLPQGARVATRHLCLHLHPWQIRRGGAERRREPCLL